MFCLTRAQASAKQVLQPCAAVKRFNHDAHSRAGVPVARQLILAGADIGKKNKVSVPSPRPVHDEKQPNANAPPEHANTTFASLIHIINRSKDLSACCQSRVRRTA